jgi:acyl-CoA thioester hydrolase
MRFDLPVEKKLVYEMSIPIRWGDMDAYGHVNNAVYFRYLEIVRIEWLNSLQSMGSPDGTGPVVVNAFCSFHRQLSYPGDVQARLFVASVGRSSFETYVTLARADTPDVLAASGGAKVVWVDFQRQASVPVPQGLRELLEA